MLELDEKAVVVYFVEMNDMVRVGLIHRTFFRVSSTRYTGQTAGLERTQDPCVLFSLCKVVVPRWSRQLGDRAFGVHHLWFHFSLMG
jgi:hypothetical protein